MRSIKRGAAPNQQIIPAVKWCFDNIGKRFFLVSSDYIFPRAANTIIRDIVTALRGEIVGEVYISFGSSVVEEAVARILGDLYVTLDGNWAYTAGKRLNEN